MAAKKTDKELLEAALKDTEKAKGVLVAVVQAARWGGKKELLPACDAAEAYLGGPVARPKLNGEA